MGLRGIVWVIFDSTQAYHIEMKEPGHPPLKIKNKTENGDLFRDMKSAKKRAKVFTKLKQIVSVFHST